MWNYLMSVLIYYVILKASVKIAKTFLEDNGRLKKIRNVNKKNNAEKPSELVVSLIPIFRVIVLVSVYYICFCSDEQFNKIIEENNNKG